jgi:hypothetical protein
MTSPTIYSQARPQLFTEEEISQMTPDNQLSYERLKRLYPEETAPFFRWSVGSLAFDSDVENHPCWGHFYANRIRELLVGLKDERICIEVFDLGEFWVYNLQLNNPQQWKILNQGVYRFQTEYQKSFAHVSSDEDTMSVMYKSRPMVPDHSIDAWWISDSLLTRMVDYWSAKKYFQRLETQQHRYEVAPITRLILESSNGEKKLVDISGLVDMFQYGDEGSVRLAFRYLDNQRDTGLEVGTKEIADRYQRFILDELAAQGVPILGIARPDLKAFIPAQNYRRSAPLILR